ncbi:hypothetical protein C8N29_10227 [Agitococcus lubricus]|uniref:Uncharacterized protein n=1 Tax=Agitococcus lubricus TaxID=1077255 RepID=A0A2T5J279_9GAMM|nr:hypothetical protein C8N29_10227 [Agitococcus lubricus]
MKDLLKKIIFIVCTGGSCLGLLAPLLFLTALGDCYGSPVFTMTPKPCGFFETCYGILCLFSSIYAWLIYFYMGLSWIGNKIVKRKWIVRGTISALISLSPFLMVSFHSSLPDLYRTLGVILVTVGSAILLACYLVFYHWKGNRKVGC